MPMHIIINRLGFYSLAAMHGILCLYRCNNVNLVQRDRGQIFVHTFVGECITVNKVRS